MDSSTSKALADATKLNNDLFELVEKQRIQLNEKDKELQENRQANEELLANMDLEKIQAIQAATFNFKTELVIAQQTIRTLQRAIWKSLLSADLCYHIEVPSGPGPGLDDKYVYVDENGYLCSGDFSDLTAALHTAQFKFIRNSDGTFSIYSVSKEKCLQAETTSYQSATYFTFSTNTYSPWKFVLFYDHQQRNKHAGILVDIYSLANGFFLSAVAMTNRVLARAYTAPTKKFLLVPVEF